METRAVHMNVPNCAELASAFVPVAVNKHFTHDERFVKPEGNVYQFMAGTGWWSNHHVYVMTADGKGLAAPQVGYAALQEGLQAWMNLPAAERKPGAHKIEDAVYPPIQDAGFPEGARKPEPPPGGLTLQVYGRALERNAKGNVVGPTRLGGVADYMPPEPMPNTVWMTEKEWKSLIPKNPKAGDSTPFPDSLAVRLTCFSFYSGAWDHNYWPPNSLSENALRLTVEKASSQKVRMRLHGPVVLDSGSLRFTGDVLGFLEYDAAKKQITAFDVVALGEKKGQMADRSLGIHGISDHARTVGYSFELADGKTPCNRAVPLGVSGNLTPNMYYASYEVAKPARR